MTNYPSLVIVLTVITALSGLSLGQLNAATKVRIEENELKFKKVPAVADIQEAVDGKRTHEERVAIEAELLADRRYLEREGDKPLLYFVVSKQGAPHTVVLESFGGGFGGDLGVMTGFRLDTGDVAGVGITTMSETPGLGTHVKDAIFRVQFEGMSKDAVFKVKKDGGEIDAVTGATISSRAVAEAIGNAKELYGLHAEAIGTAIAAGPAAGGAE